MIAHDAFMQCVRSIEYGVPYLRCGQRRGGCGHDAAAVLEEHVHDVTDERNLLWVVLRIRRDLDQRCLGVASEQV